MIRAPTVNTKLRKEAARQLKDARELNLPLSVEEAEVLQLIAAGDAACLSRDPYGVWWAVLVRNPRKALYDAQDAARTLRKRIKFHEDCLGTEDLARLRGAGRATDLTMEEVAAMRERWSAEYTRRADAAEAERQRVWEASATVRMREAEALVAEHGWVLAPGENAFSRLLDVRAYDRMHRGQSVVVGIRGNEDEVARLEEIARATAEGRAPNIDKERHP